MKEKAGPIALALVFALLGWMAGIGANAGSEETVTENPVVFWELASHDGDASIAFFEKIFDWKIEKDADTILYHVGSKGETAGINGGIFTLQKSANPGCPLSESTEHDRTVRDRLITRNINFAA